MNEGIRAAVPGAPMAAVCRAINAVLEAEGYGEYCHPPHIAGVATVSASADPAGRREPRRATTMCKKEWCS
jgi:hypothetical protein